MGYESELNAESRIGAVIYEDSSHFYRRALSVLGKDVSFSTLFGNKVGEYFASYLNDDARDYNVNIFGGINQLCLSPIIYFLNVKIQSNI